MSLTDITVIRTPEKTFEGVILRSVSSDEPYLQWTPYVQALVSEITSAQLLRLISDGFQTFYIDLLVREIFDTSGVKFEVHINDEGCHVCCIFKIDICDDKYLITYEKRTRSESMVPSKLFDHICDYLIDRTTVQSRDGMPLEKSSERRYKISFAYIDRYYEAEIDDIRISLIRALENIRDVFYENVIHGLNSLLNIVKHNKKHMEMYTELDVFGALKYILDKFCDEYNLYVITILSILSEIPEFRTTIVHQGIFFRLYELIKPSRTRGTPFSDLDWFHGQMDASKAEKIVGSFHPGYFIGFLPTSDKNVMTVISFDSMHGDGLSYHMEKVFTYTNVTFDPESKTFEISGTKYPTIKDCMKTEWVISYNTSVISILIMREALKTFSNLCKTKTVVDELKKFNVFKRINNAYEDVENDIVVRKFAWQTLRNATEDE